MEKLKVIAGINLVLLIIYTLLIGGDGYAPVVLAIVIALHILALLVISLLCFFGGSRGIAKSFLLSSLLVLVIGFSACLGVSSL
jgi:hypothetical protein